MNKKEKTKTNRYLEHLKLKIIYFEIKLKSILINYKKF